MKADDRLWDVDDVSRYLRVPVATLYQWRHHRIGPTSHRIGRHLRYVPEDVISWVREQG
ncbi:helix-turn-helix transcriptional regulator [Nonomuraea dietziae]|uniref:Putative DNA-binding transcriptional regulator AlpA n=1 Tax=Nonomuraea dietziae TaxID=65515 RepID=A0A7W5V3N0_9ACTN|nr:helix-turn-helix domain-containing protein [Nonomuraea dietziae]MBB3728354.1 putative DNA-binding transcriptional regulator AlpA [Nonomuraea dietziae]